MANGQNNWENTAAEQGWNEDSKLSVLESFIEENGLWDKLAEFAESVAEEENNQD